MTSTEEPKWIGVAEIAAELSISPRKAWELLKKLGVECLGPTRNSMREARFTRESWNLAVERSMKPPTPRGGEPKVGRGEAKPKLAASSDGDFGSWRDYVPQR